MAGGNNDATPLALTFESGDKSIRADLYSPKGSRSQRTIILLHGAAGMPADAPRTRQFTRALNENGDMVYVFYYFDRTGTTRASEPEMQARFDDWVQTVRDGIGWVHTREGKKRSIGLYGYSLGAFLAIAASSDNTFVGAVVEQAGGMWNSEEKRVGKMPPVLMVHGIKDKLVPFKDYAQPLRRVLRQRGAAVETDFVESEGHVFSEAALQSVRSETVNFFARKLPPAK